MPPLTRTCSECGTALASRSVTSKTCSDACRKKRSRRIERNKRDTEALADALPGGADEVAAMIRRETPDVIGRVMRDELAPIVREALTEDTLRAVQRMLGLTDRAVGLLEEDLESEDATVRQRAYTLLIKYTIGHPALLRPADAEPGGQMVVNFNLPRPDSVPQADDVIEAAEDEFGVCDICQEEKPITEFVAGSERCASCVAEQKERVLAAYS